MKNLFLDEPTARDINRRVDKLLRDVGNPDYNVDLSSVRQLLKLDLHYYSSKDEGLLNEVVHKLTIGAKQVLARPSLLGEAIRAFDLRALFLPDRKQILLDSSMPELKKRWGEGHETIHSILPWHADYLLGDNKKTLSPSCHERIEGEANYGTGQLLFPAKTFVELAYSSPASLAQIKRLSSMYGNTITSTLWRYVEYSNEVVFGAVGQHPKHPSPGEESISYFIRSPRFHDQFSHVDEESVFKIVADYCTWQRSGPVGSAEAVLADVNGTAHVFSMESFGNRYHVLTLGRWLKVRAPIVATV